MISIDNLPTHLRRYLSVPCIYFQSGTCQYGNRCRYFHIKPECEVTLVDTVVYIDRLDKELKRYQLERIARSIATITYCKLHDAGQADGLQSAHIHFTCVINANAFMKHMESYQPKARCKLKQVNRYTLMSSSKVSLPSPQQLLPQPKQQLSTVLPFTPTTDVPDVDLFKRILSLKDVLKDELLYNTIESIDRLNNTEGSTFMNLLIDMEPPVFAEFPTAPAQPELLGSQSSPVLPKLVDIECTSKSAIDATVIQHEFSTPVAACDIETVLFEAKSGVQIQPEKVTNWSDMCDEEDKDTPKKTPSVSWNALHICERVSTVPIGSTEDDFPSLFL